MRKENWWIFSKSKVETRICYRN